MDLITEDIVPVPTYPELIKALGEDELVEVVQKHKKKHRRRKRKKMASVETPTFLATGGADSGMGGLGLGGGLIGGVLLGALLGRNGGGLFGGNSDGVSGLNNLQGAIDTNAILSGIGDIKASVPLSEAQMQLALAGAQADITSQTMQQTIALQQQGFNGQLANLAGFSTTKDAVDSLSTQVAIGQGVTNTNIERLGWQLSREGSANTERVLAQLAANEQATLNRIITTQAAELAELRNEGARARDRQNIEISMINNQNQNQLQFQQQSQVLQALSGGLVDALQSIRATNQAINIGGTQVANPSNTNTNVRA